MEELFNKLKTLSQLYPNVIKLYPNVDLKHLAKSIGKIPYAIDKQLYQFLKFTNGMSVLDYCFLSFYNKEFGSNIHEYTFDLWKDNSSLAGEFVCFMTTTINVEYGYVINPKSDGFNKISIYSKEIYGLDYIVVYDSFYHFLNAFVLNLELYLQEKNNSNELYINGFPE